MKSLIHPSCVYYKSHHSRSLLVHEKDPHPPSDSTGVVEGDQTSLQESSDKPHILAPTALKSPVPIRRDRILPSQPLVLRLAAKHSLLVTTHKYWRASAGAMSAKSGAPLVVRGMLTQDTRV